MQSLNYFFKVFLVYFSCFMMAYGESIARLPSADQALVKQELLEVLLEHKMALIGHIDTSHCDQNEPLIPQEFEKVIDTSFVELISFCKKTAEVEEVENPVERQTCHPNVTDGLKQAISPLLIEKSQDKKNYILTKEWS